MPTIGSQPSLKSTQAVGAVLLHQFARQRFLEAGLDEDIIREAENIEHLDLLTSELFNDSTSSTLNGCNSNKTNTNDTSSSTIILNSNESTTTTHSTTIHNNSTASISHNDTTLITEANSSTEGAEHFLSMANSSTATTNNNPSDHTLYHSMHTSHGHTDNNNVTSTLDQLQSSSIMAGYGKELRRIADEFEKTRERQIIKERANQVQLSDINKESFFELMSELFDGGITGERIVMLFLFSTDVALRAASQAQNLVVKLLSWSFSFIIEIVCKVVHELGGWDNLLCRQLPYALMLCFLALGTCAFAVYLNRALRA